MAYLSLYRKYRSQDFGELEGQEHVTRTLQNALKANRVSHAYLLCGPRGTGKTSTARILAKALNCEEGPTAQPCGTCSACVQISEGRFLDVQEIDAASNRGIDDIRDLRDNVIYAPTAGRYKVYVIDEAHQITNDAFNAFLKTLEEPPPHVIFILATTDPHRIPATILSRCQRFDFRPATRAQLRERVTEVASLEGATVTPAAADLIAREAQGGWRDALSLLEQVLAFAEGEIGPADVHAVLGSLDIETVERLADLAHAGQGGEAYGLLDELMAEGKDPRQILRSLMGHFRTLMLISVGSAPEVDPDRLEAMRRQATQWGKARLLAALQALALVDREMRWSDQPRLSLELALVQLMPPSQSDRAVREEAAAPRPEPVRAAPAPAARVRDQAPPPAAAAAPAPATVRNEAQKPEEAPAPAPAQEAAPAKSPVPSKSAAQPPAEGDLAAIRARWHSALQELKRMRMVHLQSYLASTEPESLKDGVLVIRFSTGTWLAGFTKREGEFVPALKEAIRTVTGLEVEIRAVGPEDRAGASPQAGPSTAAKPPAARQPAAAPVVRSEPPPAQKSRAQPANDVLLEGDELLREIVDVTGGRYLDSDE